MSARAAWRLISLGFTRVIRYMPGKMHWMANGLPLEGKETNLQRAGDLAKGDVPTCQVSDRIGALKDKVQKTGWDACVVLNEERVVLGLVRLDALEEEAQKTAEDVMETAPRTYRLDAALERTLKYMQKNEVDSVLVTTTYGVLVGMLGLADVEKAVNAQSKTG